VREKFGFSESGDFDKIKLSLIAAAVAGAPLILQMVGDLVFAPPFIALGLLIISATILQLVVAGFYAEVLNAIKTLRPNFESLIVISTTSLWAASLLLWYRDGIEAGAAYAGINALAIPAALYGKFAAGHVLSAVPQASGDSDIVPRDARLKQYRSSGEKVPIRDVKLGDTVEVLAGERAPVDGIVVEGMAEFIGGEVTGDPMPRHKGRGERVLAGEMCFGGKVTIQAFKPGLESMINDAASYGRLHSRYQQTSRLIDRVLTPMFWTVFAVAVTGGVIIAGFTNAMNGLINGLAIMGMGVPAGFGLASSLPQYFASALLREKGVRLHQPDVLETARKLDYVYASPVDLFIMRVPRFSQVVSDESQDEVMAFAWGLAKKCAHPMEPALRLACESMGVQAKEMKKVFYDPGRGIRGEYDERTILFGNPAQLSANGVSYRLYDERARQMETPGKMLYWIAESYPRKTCLGILSFATVIRSSAIDAAKEIHDAGLTLDLLSPFNSAPHVRLLASVPFDTLVEASTPILAYNSVIQTQTAKKCVAVAAISPLDLPAAQAADVTIMSTTGAPMLLSYASITMDHADPLRLAFTVVTAQKAGRLIKRGLQISGGFAAAACLVGFVGGLTPVVASVMALASLGLVGLNAWRLKAQK